MIVPQHGLPIAGAAAIARFIDWVENLVCGVDLLREGPGRVRLSTAAARSR